MQPYYLEWSCALSGSVELMALYFRTAVAPLVFKLSGLIKEIFRFLSPSLSRESGFVGRSGKKKKNKKKKKRQINNSKCGSLDRSFSSGEILC